MTGDGSRREYWRKPASQDSYGEEERLFNVSTKVVRAAPSQLGLSLSTPERPRQALWRLPGSRDSEVLVQCLRVLRFPQLFSVERLRVLPSPSLATHEPVADLS